MSDGCKSDQKQSLAERVITATALWTSRLLGIANGSRGNLCCRRAASECVRLSEDDLSAQLNYSCRPS